MRFKPFLLTGYSWVWQKGLILVVALPREKNPIFTGVEHL